MTAIHSAGRIYGVNPDRSLAGLPSSMTIRYTQEAHGETKHPVVRTHVETGRKCLYVKVASLGWWKFEGGVIS